MTGWLADEVTDVELWRFLTTPTGRLVCAFVLASVGLWFLLPKGKADWRRAGMILCVLAGCFFASLFKPLGNLLETTSFCVLASITIVSAVSTIVARSPVYSAIWFAVTLLATGGLFLLNGAQFLGVATVAVYAGAIVVTFLFVLMLAQPEGHTFYDRISWGGTPAALAVLAGLAFVVATVSSVWSLDRLSFSVPLGSEGSLDSGTISADLRTAFEENDIPLAEIASVTVIDAGVKWLIHDGNDGFEVTKTDTLDIASAEPNVVKVSDEQHVAALGGMLFSKHLIAIQVAGTLLFAALVGAVAIAGRDQLTGRAAASNATFSSGGRSGSQIDA